MCAGLTVTAVEGDTPALTLTLTPMLDTAAEMGEEDLQAVVGGRNFIADCDWRQ